MTDSHTWHETRKHIALELGLFDLHPFMNSHFHFLVTAECANIAEMHQGTWSLC
jgi:hypothetical protein